MSWLYKAAFGSAEPSFEPQTVTFGRKSIQTTALLAEGGYSFVYTGVDPAGGRKYALKKVLAQDAETAAIAEIEIELLEQLRGPGIVECVGTLRKRVSTTTTEYWMLLELCEGSLVDLLYLKRGDEYEKRPALAEARVLEIFEGVAEAVARLHALLPPVTHRDLKLENVLLAPSGEYVLCDFGSATRDVLPAQRSRKQALEEEERIAKYSTAMYRAPEMVDLYRKHEVGPKADCWALGCILYALCFRAHPFAADSPLQILNGAYTIPPDSPYSESVHALVRSLLAADPTERPTASEAAAAARACGRDPPPPKPSAAPAPPLALPPLDAGFDAAKWTRTAAALEAEAARLRSRDARLFARLCT